MRTGTKTALLLALFALYYLIPIEFRALWQPDETRYAEISREMLAGGNWVVPHFFGLRYFEKPIAGYWVNNIGQFIFGHTPFGVRAGAIFSTTFSALLLYWLGRRMFASRTIALTGGLIFLTSLLVYGVGTYAVIDPILLLWLVAAMCSYWLAAQANTTQQRLGGYLLLGAACGMGFMTKGFLALAVPVLAIVPWAIWQRRFAELLRWGLLTIVTAALISAPWHWRSIGRKGISGTTSSGSSISNGLPKPMRSIKHRSGITCRYCWRAACHGWRYCLAR